MKRAIFTLCMLSSCAVYADGDFQCTYAKADIINGQMGPLTVGGKSKVSIINESMKAFRPDGSYIYSPPIKDDKGATWMASDGSKFYAVSKDFTNFSISDKIARKTEQWSECTLVRSESNNSEKVTKPAKWETRKLTQTESHFVETAIKNRLKDPESARFQHSPYVSNGNGAYCGFVNSKNSYGGYVGDTPFMAIVLHDKKGKPTGAGVISVGGDNDEIQATILTCQDNGYFN